MLFFDPMYIIFALPGILLAAYASFKTKLTFNKYSQIRSSTGISGAEAAHLMLSREGIGNVSIEETHGFLTDHYDPISRTLRLSSNVYRSNSLAALGVACHEAGHALQHAKGYLPLHLRTVMVPATNVSSYLSYPLILLGFMLSAQNLVLIGAMFFASAVLFSLVTLPVEWDASRRAKNALVSSGIVSSQESKGAADVLNAAFLTYVAAAVSSLLTLLYYLIRAGLFGSDSD